MDLLNVYFLFGGISIGIIIAIVLYFIFRRRVLKDVSITNPASWK